MITSRTVIHRMNTNWVEEGSIPFRSCFAEIAIYKISTKHVSLYKI